ncbi:PREDICTED: uncharacterized protein LOC103336452 isoform X3 [Prunus mume]|uniref:Uncharacterized protein LOC103336452 isoform X3 n=1 Tax=Prunus mume TaxID=102107 RepID=A0ABM0PCQ0_PRUMU|nr:PREDICTED: uncharacterized protein LOC103336452 isoform X3 [Prunus mume]
MADWNISNHSAAVVLNPSRDVRYHDRALPTASRQETIATFSWDQFDLLISKLEELGSTPSAAAELTPCRDVQDHAFLSSNLSEIQKSLVDWKKSTMEEFRLIRSSSTSPTPSETAVIDGSPNHPSLPMDRDHASLTVNQGEDRSVFLIVSFSKGECCHAIYEVKFKHGGEVDDMGGGEVPALLEPTAKISRIVQSARIFDLSQIYLFTQDGDDRPRDMSFGGYVFDTKDRKLYSSIPPTLECKRSGTVVSAYDGLYYLEDTSSFIKDPDPSFEKYDPVKKAWQQLPTFPFSDDLPMDVMGYAVCYGIILYSFWDLKKDFGLAAFHVGRGDWNRVKVDSYAYAPFRGRAVVVGEYIYALHVFEKDEIIGFSLRMDKDEDGGVAYSLSNVLRLRGLEIANPPLPFYEYKSDYLIHLGNQDLLHVKTGSIEEHRDVQHLCITTFQIVVREVGWHMIKTLHSSVLRADIEGRDWFFINFGFTPECRDYEPTEMDYERVERHSAASVNPPKQEDDTLHEQETKPTLDENLLMWELTHSEVHTRQLAKKEAKQRKASMKQGKTARKKELASFIQGIAPMQHGKGKQKKPKKDHKPKTWRKDGF